MRLRPLPLLAGAALLVVTGVVHGLRTDRWSIDQELAAAVARLDTVPMTSGDWEAEPSAINERQLDIAQITGYLSRTYRNRRTGDQVTVLIVCGRAGQVAVHSPDICYTSSGFQMSTPPVKHPVSSADGEKPAFWAATFSKPGLKPETLRILWAWGGSGTWKASDSPRLDFARSRALYKLYVVHRLANPNEPLASDPSLKLLWDLLPDLRRCLSP